MHSDQEPQAVNENVTYSIPPPQNLHTHIVYLGHECEAFKAKSLQLPRRQAALQPHPCIRTPFPKGRHARTVRPLPTASWPRRWGHHGASVQIPPAP